jgi:DNA polymerase III epsilon subunit-like protein
VKSLHIFFFGNNSQALTRSGMRCSITSACRLVDNHGRSVAEPLLCGSKRCIYHAQYFVLQAGIEDRDAASILCFVDLETTGLSFQRSFIVEVGACVHGSGAVFGALVRPPDLTSDMPVGSDVHGITSAELACGIVCCSVIHILLYL